VRFETGTRSSGCGPENAPGIKQAFFSASPSVAMGENERLAVSPEDRGRIFTLGSMTARLRPPADQCDAARNLDEKTVMGISGRGSRHEILCWTPREVSAKNVEKTRWKISSRDTAGQSAFFISWKISTGNATGQGACHSCAQSGGRCLSLRVSNPTALAQQPEDVFVFLGLWPVAEDRKADFVGKNPGLSVPERYSFRGARGQLDVCIAIVVSCSKTPKLFPA